MLFKKNLGKGLLGLLRRAPTPQDIIELGLVRMKNLLHKESRGHLGLERAEKVLESAKRSVGVRDGVGVLKMQLEQALESLDFIQGQLNKVERKLEETLHKVPYAKILLSIRQMGEVTLATILGETGDLRLYSSGKQLVKLAGLNLYEVSSGKHTGRRRITKRGRPLLRQILYMASLRLIIKKQPLYDFYQRLTNNGKPKMKAVIAVMCKLLRILFTVVRDNAILDDSLLKKHLIYQDAA